MNSDKDRFFLALMYVSHGFPESVQEKNQSHDGDDKADNDEDEIDFRQIGAAWFGIVQCIDDEHHKIHDWNHLQNEIEKPFAFCDGRAVVWRRLHKDRLDGGLPILCGIGGLFGHFFY